MANNLRTRNQYPFNFEDGLKAKGKHVAIYVETLADLKALNTLKNQGNEVVTIIGKVTISDNLGGTYRWSTDSTVTDNNDTVIKPNDITTGAGRWILFNRNTI